MQREKVAAYRLLMANVYELAALSRRDSETVARQVGVTVTQWHTMSVLSDQDAGASVPQIAARLGVTRQAVQRVVDQLLAGGHVERVANPHHETSPLVQLTGPGHEVLANLWELSDPPRAAMLTGADAARLDDARRTLQELIASLQKARG